MEKTETTQSIFDWCEDQNERIKALQDICLDNPLDDEAKGILRRLIIIQNELFKLSKDCEERLFI